MDPRTLLCFGDSNTWGYVPGTHGRYPRHVRWPGVAATALGDGWLVVEAGLNGRTTVFEDPLGDKAGVRHLGPVLDSAAPVDVVAILLGVNDLKTRFGASAYEIAEGAGVLIDRVRSSRAGPAGVAPLVLLITPPPVGDLGGWAQRDPAAFAGCEEGWIEALPRSERFSVQYARVAGLRGVPVLDAGALVTSSPLDGIHWPPEGHEALGRAVAARLAAPPFGA